MGALVSLQERVVALAPRIQKYCFKLKREYLPTVEAWEEEDLYQESMLRILRGLPSFTEEVLPNALMRWCITVSRNTAVNLYRKEQVCKNCLELEDIYSPPLTHQSTEWQVSHQLALMSNILLPNQIKMVSLRYQGYKYHEIGLLLSIPEGTVKSNINRAKKQLKSAAAAA